MYEDMFSKRAQAVGHSFLREILSLTKNNPSLVSFAGGLPNPDLFPVKEMRIAAQHALDDIHAKETLQYSSTEGHKNLREFIAVQYQKKEDITVSPDNILIINGSQQALDLIGKTFIDEGDTVLVESPTYLAAVQAFGVYGAQFRQVSLESDGPNTTELEQVLKKHRPKFFYMIPNFQNPTGITCSLEKRKKIASILSQHGTILIEDDPYGEIRFEGHRVPTMYKLYENTILLGSFSKTTSPGLRLGWITAPKDIYDKLYSFKQASDLHSNNLSQHILYQYIAHNDTDAHIADISKVYAEQKDAMIASIKKHLPKEVIYTNPQGGMFLWLTFPDSVDTLKLFDIALKEGVAFVPGAPFYATDPKTNTARLNFSNASIQDIQTGIQRLAKAYEKYHIT